MRWLAVLICFALNFSLAQAAEPNRFPDEVQSALASAGKVTLYSIEPWEEPEGAADTFHRWKLLGKTTLTGKNAKAAIGAFRAALAAGDLGAPAACFDPRHALRVVSSSHTYDLVLCYECGGMEVLRDGVMVEKLFVRGRPARLNGLLTTAGIRLSRRP